MKSVTNHVQKCMKIKPKIGTPVKVKEFDWKRNSRSETTIRFILNFKFSYHAVGQQEFYLLRRTSLQNQTTENVKFSNRIILEDV